MRTRVALILFVGIQVGMLAAVLERQKTFRRVRGFKGMPKLLDGLRQHDARLDRGVESEAHVA